MEFLKDIHRQLFENWNFSRENRLVFEEAPEPQPEKKEQEGERPEGEPEGKVQEEIKKIKESIIRLKKESQKLIETYAKEGLTEDEDKTSKYYSGKRVEIYKRMEEFEKKTPELQAAQAIHKEIKELTAEISQHAEKGTTKEFKAETTEEEKEKKAEAPAEKLREGRDKAKAAIEKFIVEKFQGIPAIHIESGEIRELDMATLIKKPTSQTLINTFLNKLPEDRIKEVEKNPNLTPTKDEVKFFREAFCKITGIEEISDSDPKEMEAVKKLIGDKLPAQGGSLAEILSRTHNIVEEDGQLTINGDAVKDVAGLKPYLPANIQATFDAAIKKNPEDKTLANLEQIAKRNVDGLAGFQKMLDSMGESKEGGKKMGAIEGLMALLQLLPTIMEALKKGDFTIVNEMMADFNKGENPAKNVSESKKGYDKILKDKSPDLKTLLSVYEDPSTNNQAANDLFCEGKTEEEIKTDPLGKYRLMAKPAIQAQLAQKLGLRISKMESDDMGTKVEGMARGNKKISVDFYQKEGKLVANVISYKQETLPEGGKDWVEDKNLDVADANWEKVQKELGMAVAKKPGEEKQSAESTLADVEKDKEKPDEPKFGEGEKPKEVAEPEVKSAVENKPPETAVVTEKKAEEEPAPKEKKEEPKPWPPSRELRTERKEIDQSIRTLKKADPDAYKKFVAAYQDRAFSPKNRERWYQVTDFERNWLDQYRTGNKEKMNNAVAQVAREVQEDVPGKLIDDEK